MSSRFDAARSGLERGVDTVVILVNYRGARDSIECIESLGRSRGARIGVSICDNASPDDSVAVLARYLSRWGAPLALAGTREMDPFDLYIASNDSALPGVTETVGAIAWIAVVKSPDNRGFAAGNNAALRVARLLAPLKYAWFLNNDTTVCPDALLHLSRKMAACEDVGLCGSTLLFHADPSRVQALGGACVSTWTGLTREIGSGQRWEGSVDEHAIEEKADYIVGAAMFARIDFIDEVGPMSEDFFLYYEELDWAMRAKASRFRLGYASGSLVYHKEGASIGTGKRRDASDLSEFYSLQSRIIVTRKHFPSRLWSVVLVGWAQVAIRLATLRLSKARALARVLMSGPKTRWAAEH